MPLFDKVRKEAIFPYLFACFQLALSPPIAAVLLTTASTLVLAGAAEAQVDDDEDDDDDDDADEDDADDDDILDDDSDVDDGNDIDDGGDVDDVDDPGDEDLDDVDDGGDTGDVDDVDDIDDGDDVDDAGDTDDVDDADEGNDDDGGDDDGGEDDDGDDDDGGEDDDGQASNGARSDDDEEDDEDEDEDDDDDVPAPRSREDDAPGGAGIRGVTPSSGTEARDPDERPDTRSGASAALVDDEGYPLANRDILSFDLGDSDIALLEELGFKMVEQKDYAGLGARLNRFRPPSGMSLPEAADTLRESLPAAPFDYNHVFGLPASDRLEDEGRKPQKLGDAFSGEGATIAIIDTLVDKRHPSLSGQKVQVADFARNGRGRDTEHGTAVASIIVGYDLSADYRGVVPGAFLLAANVFTVSKDGIPETDTRALLEALDWAASEGAAVINFSLAGPPSEVLENAIKRLIDKGVVITAAVGNDGPAAPPVFPATYDGVVGVTAVDIDGKIYRRAGRGDQVDIAAPGVKLVAASAGGGYDAVTGTSFATPVVSALLALEHPAPASEGLARAEAFARKAKDLGSPGPDQVYGLGLVQINVSEVD